MRWMIIRMCIHCNGRGCPRCGGKGMEMHDPQLIFPGLIGLVVMTLCGLYALGMLAWGLLS